jgi:hypothetical protein
MPRNLITAFLPRQRKYYIIVSVHSHQAPKLNPEFRFNTFRLVLLERIYKEREKGRWQSIFSKTNCDLLEVVISHNIVLESIFHLFFF